MLEIIRKTGVFLIMAETLYQFVQENRYARYIRLLIRLMTVALLIVPVLEFVKEGSSDAFYGHLAEFETEYEKLLEEDGLVFSQEEGAGQGTGDMELAVTQRTESDILEICSDRAGEAGYRIDSVSVREGLVLFELTAAGSINGETDARTAAEGDVQGQESGNGEIQIGEVERIQIEIGGESAEEDTPRTSVAEDALRLKEDFANLLGISDTKVEVRIYG